MIGGQAVAAMRRCGVDWINNVAQGGRCETVSLDATLGGLAESAVRTLDMHYAGVDIIHDLSGRFYVLEVNSVPAWRGLQSTTQLAVAQLLADDFLMRAGEFSPVRVAV